MFIVHMERSVVEDAGRKALRSRGRCKRSVGMEKSDVRPR